MCLFIVREQSKVYISLCRDGLNTDSELRGGCSAKKPIKFVGLGLSFVIAAGSFVGFQSKPIKSYASSPATLNVLTYTQPQEKVVYQNLEKQYLAKHNVKINWTFTTGDVYPSKIKASFAANNIPDVFYVAPGDLRAYVNAKRLLPLNSYLKKLNISTKDIWPQAINRYMYNGTTMGKGTLYALPKDVSAFGFCYNKTLFQKNHIPLPSKTKPYTLQQFLSVCQKLTKDTNGDGKIDQWGAGFDPHWSIEPFIWTCGADFLDKTYTKVTINNAKFQNALQYFVDLTTKYKVTPSYSEAMSLAYYQRFLQGQEGFFACGNWDMGAFNNKSTFKYDYDLIPWPVSTATNKSITWTGSLGFCVSNTSANKEEAVKLVKYLSADTITNKALAKAQIQMPNIMSYAKGSYVKDCGITKNVSVFFNYIEKTGRPGPTEYTYNSEWWDQFQTDLPTVLQGKDTVAKFCAAEQPKMQAKLDNAIALSKSQK